MIHKAELVISQLLRIGVWACGAVIGLGWLLSLLAHSRNVHDNAQSLLQSLGQGAAYNHSLTDLITGIGSLQPNAWMAAGLILLISLPILRVALTVLIFVFERDRVYILLSSTVLLILIASALLGKTE